MRKFIPSLREWQCELLRKHGLAKGHTRLFTLVLGTGGQSRGIHNATGEGYGFLKPDGVYNCTDCENDKLRKFFNLGRHRDWYEGFHASERHWSVDPDDSANAIGLTLECFYSKYMSMLQEAWHAYTYYDDITRTPLANNRRVAIVEVSIDHILHLEEVAPTNSGNVGNSAALVLKSSKLKVLNDIDMLPIVPTSEMISFILGASPEWKTKLHFSLDAMQFRSWRTYPEIMSKLLFQLRRF